MAETIESIPLSGRTADVVKVLVSSVMLMIVLPGVLPGLVWVSIRSK
jgi:hypothetical protein